MDTIKLFFLTLLLTIKHWGIDLWTETKNLVLSVMNRIKLAIQEALTAVLHIVYIPVHVAQWVWGCAKASWNALSVIWRK